MNKRLAQAIWLCILLGPLLLWVVCKQINHQHDEVRILAPKYPNPNGSSDSLFKTVGDFSFMSHTGEMINQDSLRGYIYVANVIFTRCSGVCPKLSSSFTRVQEMYKDVPEVKLLSITVDPENDSVAVLRHYADQLHAIDHKWYFITGQKKELYKFAHEQFFFKAYEGEGGELGFIHDETVRLIDKEGRMRGEYYNGTNPMQIEHMIEDIRLLLIDYATKK